MSCNRAASWGCGVLILLWILSVITYILVFRPWDRVLRDGHLYILPKEGRAIFDAVYAENAARVKELTLSGADANAKIWVDDAIPERLIHLASTRGNIDVVRALLDGGADPNALDGIGDTPLRRMAETAFRPEYDACTEALVRAGAHLESATSDNGLTAFHLCALRGNTSYGSVLLRLGANVNAIAKLRQTPLHLVCDIPFEQPSEPMIRFLVEQGADLSLRNQNGETPLDILKRRNLGHFEHILIANPSATQSDIHNRSPVEPQDKNQHPPTP